MSANAIRARQPAQARWRLSALEKFDPRRLSLRWQLSLAIVLVMSLALAIAAGLVLRHAPADATQAQPLLLLMLMVLMAFASNALVLLLVTRALRPLAAATAALSRLQEAATDGRFDLPPLPQTSSRDLSALLLGIDQLAQSLARSTGEHRRLLLQQLDAAEDERRQIACELQHDAGPQLDAIEMAVIGLHDSAPDVALVRDAAGAIQQLKRRMIRRLRPAALDSCGLADALQALLQQWQASQPQIAVISEIDPLCNRLDTYTATHVYRIVQQALSNTLRHAQADQLQLQLLIVNREIRLRIADDGHGFDPQLQTGGLGLIGLRERVRALGGQIDIITGRYKGCRLQIRLPAQLPPRSRSAAASTHSNT